MKNDRSDLVYVHSMEDMATLKVCDSVLAKAED